ncbi:hypothetical protein F5Y13DRAFT_202926 [Hypoxylon sp. FL1857]|nr:hypothetical protein F5Y13DRAFT_202926 [Hypoxylon sp. FL1857]
MSAQGDIVGSHQPTDEDNDVVMADADEQQQATARTTLGRGLRITIEDHTIRLRSDGRAFSVDLFGADINYPNPLGLAFASTRAVTMPFFDTPSNGTIQLIPSPQTRTIIRRAWGYLLAKKEDEYSQFRSKHDKLLNFHIMTRQLKPYEENQHVIETEKAAVLMLSGPFVDVEITGEPGRPLCLLLLERHNHNGVTEYYNPADGCDYEQPGPNHIILRECEEALALLYDWDCCFNTYVGGFVYPGQQMPSNSHPNRSW